MNSTVFSLSGSGRWGKNKRGWEYEYYLPTVAHCVADLSQPLHNFPYADNPASDGKSYPEIGFWAKEYHLQFDSVLDSYIPLTCKDNKTFQKMITPIQIVSGDDLKKEISKTANSAIILANVLRAIMKGTNQ